MRNNMRQLEKNLRMLLIGTARTGKSWLKDWIIFKYMKENKRRFFVVIDDNINNCLELKKKGFHIEEINSEKIIHDYDYRQFILDKEKVVFIITDLNNEEIQDFLQDITATVWTLGDTLFVIDECWQYVNRYTNPQGLLRVIRGGAKIGVDVMLVTHRLVDLPTEITNLMNIFITFRLVEKNSIERLSQYFDQFTLKDNKKLIDPELKNAQKKKCEKIIRSKDLKQILRGLENRYFLYSDTREGIQEITTSNNLTI